MAFLIIRELLIRLLTGSLFCFIVTTTIFAGRFPFFLMVIATWIYLTHTEWVQLAPRNRMHRELIYLGWMVMPFFILLYLNRVVSRFTLLWLFLCVWIHDSSAYLTGKLFGKTPLAPQISPKKTIEGFLGGLGALMIFFYLTRDLVTLFPLSLDTFIKKPLIWYLFMPILTAIGATMGDLFESWLKRKAKIKDSGMLIPGHGGLFDRIDSLLFLLIPIGILILYFHIF